MFRQLLEKVRIEGRVEIAESSLLRDMLPIIYNGEADPSNPRAVKYWNSGGRALIFEKGNTVYRVKGVDPSAKLTERVATSPKNRINNVVSALLVAQADWNANQKEGLMHLDGKPFGVCYIEQAECEKRTFETLDKSYELLGIENPCKFLGHFDTGVEVKGKKTYQTVFRLPSIESDIRVHEWDSLLTNRLDKCSASEIAAKNQAINRLYGRFVYWAGVNVGLLASNGLLPTTASFVPQNWVIGKYKEGYGIFRVDHTSTQKVDPAKALEELLKSRHHVENVPAAVNEFSVFPSRTQAAARPTTFLGRERAGLKFSQILYLTEYKGADESTIINIHKQLFEIGISSALGATPLVHIPEDLFRQAIA